MQVQESCCSRTLCSSQLLQTLVSAFGACAGAVTGSVSAVQVRIAACAALVAFVRSAGSNYCSTNSGYLAAGVVLHMDDGDQAVAEAACQVGGVYSVVKLGVEGFLG